MNRKRKTKLESDLIEGIESALRFVERRPTGGRTHVVMVPDVRAVRRRMKMSQAGFSQRFGIPKRTIQDWEQGRRVPDQAAISYLKVIAKNPSAVQRALAR